MGLWDALGRMLDENQFGTRAHAAMAAFHNMIEDLAEAVPLKSLQQSPPAFIEDLLPATAECSSRRTHAGIRSAHREPERTP